MTTPQPEAESPSLKRSPQASADEEAEFQRMRKAILKRSDRRLWQLVPRKTLFKAFWLLLVLVSILWLRRNAATMTHFFDQALSPREAAK